MRRHRTRCHLAGRYAFAPSRPTRPRPWRRRSSARSARRCSPRRSRAPTATRCSSRSASPRCWKPAPSSRTRAPGGCASRRPRRCPSCSSGFFGPARARPRRPPAVDAIRAAAVLGTRFTAGLLAAMLGTTPDSLAPVLTELTESDLVHHAENSRTAFLFRHALIQEATYLALLRAERRDLHARAARAIAAAAAGRLPEVAAILGRHYAIAENAGRAVHFLELAGDHATEAFANDEAVASFREALAVAESAGDALAARPGALNAKPANVPWAT